MIWLEFLTFLSNPTFDPTWGPEELCPIITAFYGVGCKYTLCISSLHLSCIMSSMWHSLHFRPRNTFTPITYHWITRHEILRISDILPQVVITKALSSQHDKLVVRNINVATKRRLNRNWTSLQSTSPSPNNCSFTCYWGVLFAREPFARLFVLG